MFSTFPTALGKLGQLRSSFPQFPQPLLPDIVLKKERKQSLREGLSKSSGQDAVKSVKTSRPGHSPLARFEVTTYGRFSSDHRGVFARPTRHAARCFGQAGANAVHENRHTIIDFLSLAHYRHTKRAAQFLGRP